VAVIVRSTSTCPGCAASGARRRPGRGSCTPFVVADEDPVIPLGAGERGRSDRGSTGLGLDIARRSAEAAGGHLTISRNEVVLTLAAP